MGHYARRFHFDNRPAAARSLQGDSQARWFRQPQNRGIFGRGGRAVGGSLDVVTTNLSAGYLRPNGVPYSERAVVKEFFDTFTMPEGGAWLIVTTVVNDPEYLTQEFVHGLCLPDTFVRAYGMPHILKFVHTPRLVIGLEEYNATYRQIFLDGRALPEDPNPAWNGYSVGRWEGDSLVVDSIGFRDDLWLDVRGSPLTNAGKVRERMTRPDFGHLNVEVNRRRPEGVYTAVDGHITPADPDRYGNHRRDLPRE